MERGSCVMRVVDQKLYAMKLEGVANQSFDAGAAQFNQLVASARPRKQGRASSAPVISPAILPDEIHR